MVWNHDYFFEVAQKSLFKWQTLSWIRLSSGGFVVIPPPLYDGWNQLRLHGNCFFLHEFQILCIFFRQVFCWFLQSSIFEISASKNEIFFSKSPFWTYQKIIQKMKSHVIFRIKNSWLFRYQIYSERSEAEDRVSGIVLKKKKMDEKKRKWMKKKATTTTDRPTTTFFDPPPPLSLVNLKKSFKKFHFLKKISSFRNATKIFGRLNYAKKIAFDAVFIKDFLQ